MEFIDTHCHLYVDEFDGDIREVIRRAQDQNITRFYLPAIDSSSHEKMFSLAGEYPGICIPMIGLHPCSVKDNYQQEIDTVKELAKQYQVAAIGEIGLDYYWDKSLITLQQEAFRQQIRLAIELNLPIVIHSRDSTDDCIKIVKEFPELNRKGIFHCFSGNQQQGEQIIDLGFFLGIGGVITYKNSGMAEVLHTLPLESMVLETDAPYLSPVPFRGKRNESSYLRYIAGKLAEIKGVSVEKVAAITTANAQKIFGN